MKTFVALIMLAKLSLACSVTSDFQFATIEEQIRNAGAIVVGNVTNVSDPINEAVVALNRLDFYRGCVSGSSINVSNFRGSSLCGPGIPRVGDRIIVFACDSSSSNASLDVNQFVPFTGWVEATEQNLQKVRNATMTSPQRCNFGKRVDKCYNRDQTRGGVVGGGVYRQRDCSSSSCSEDFIDTVLGTNQNNRNYNRNNNCSSSSCSEDLLDAAVRKRDEYRQSWDRRQDEIRDSYNRRRIGVRDSINRNVDRILTPSDSTIVYRS